MRAIALLPNPPEQAPGLNRNHVDVTFDRIFLFFPLFFIRKERCGYNSRMILPRQTTNTALNKFFSFLFLMTNRLGSATIAFTFAKTSVRYVLLYQVNKLRTLTTLNKFMSQQSSLQVASRQFSVSRSAGQ